MRQFSIIALYLVWGKAVINEVPCDMRHLIFFIKFLLRDVKHLIIHIAAVRCLNAGLTINHLSPPHFLVLLSFCEAPYGTLSPSQGRNASKRTCFVSHKTPWDQLTAEVPPQVQHIPMYYPYNFATVKPHVNIIVTNSYNTTTAKYKSYV